MNDDLSQDQTEDRLLGQAASEFFAAVSQGDNPSVSDYARRFPTIATLIERALPAIAMLNNTEAKQGGNPSGKLPKRLGDFQIVKKIGHGGMGVVYEAEQLSMGRKVALKILPLTAMLDETRLERFQLEVRAAATLDHPHCVPIYAVGEDQGVHYYAMKLISGQTLAEVIYELQKKDGQLGQTPTNSKLKEPLKPDQTLSQEEDSTKTSQSDSLSLSRKSKSQQYFRQIAKLGVQTAKALHHAHERGIVHRDIKPSNLILDTNGSIWITDFGLARIESDAGLTMTGDMLGTLRYMSPEQALGKRALVDHRVDIYSLGITLYELLALRPAIEGEDRAKILRDFAESEPPSLSKLVPEIPIELETIISKAIEKNPSDRYATAEELAADLGRYLRHEPILAKRSTAAERTIKWARRYPAAASLIAVSMLFSIAVVVGSIWYSTKLAASAAVAEERRLEASRARTEAEQHLDIAETQEQIASEFQYAVKMRQAFYSWEAAELNEVEGLLAQYADGTRWASHRGFEWYYLNRMLHAEIQTFQVDDPEVYDVAFSPDGKTLAACGQQGWVRFWDLESGKLRRVLDDHQSCVNALSYSSDGKIFATASCDKTAKLWDSATNMQLANLSSTDAAMHCVEIRDDGLLAIGDDQGTIQIYDINTNQILTTLNHGGAEIHGLAWSPDGQFLASTNYEEGAWLWNTTDWTHTSLPAVKGFSPCSVVFAPDAMSLAIGSTEGRILLWDVSSLSRKAELIRHDFGHVRCLSFTPDGTQLISGADDKRVVVWDVDRKQVVRTIRGHRKRLQSIAVSRDGTRLASAALDGSIKIWNLNDRSDRLPYLRIEPKRSGIGSISPKGTKLAITRSDQTEVWDILQGKPISQILLNSISYGYLSWSKDGRLLALASDTLTETHIWDLEQARAIHTLKINAGLTNRVMVLSPLGDEVALRDHKKGLTIHDLKSGTSRPLAYPGHVIDACYFPDGKTVACIGFVDGDVHLFSTDGRSQRVLNAALDRPPISINISEDARFIAVGDAGGVVRVVDVQSGDLHRVLRGHECEVTCVAVSRHGQTVASADVDGFVKLWHLETGELITTFTIGQTRPMEIIFASDDSALLCWCIASEVGGELYVWSAR